MSPIVVHRKYRAGMVVLFNGQRFEVDGVEFWEHDEKLTLRAIDGNDSAKTKWVWAHQVEFTNEVAA